MERNLKARANSKKPKNTLTVFNQPPDLGKEFNQPGKAANKVNGNATLKIDDVTWGHSNTGVWSRNLNEITKDMHYTDWKEYVGDTVIDVDTDEIFSTRLSQLEFDRYLIGRNRMAKPTTVKIRLNSTADTGHFYVTKKNARTMTEKMVVRKYDPIVRKHVEYKEGKIK